MTKANPDFVVVFSTPYWLTYIAACLVAELIGDFSGENTFVTELLILKTWRRCKLYGNS